MTVINDNYKEEIFYLWYNSGKPSGARLSTMIPQDFESRYPDVSFPSIQTLRNWISDEFRGRGFDLDEEAKRQLDNLVIADKVVMLSRHAKLGEHMQEIAMNFIESHVDDLSLPTSVRLLVEGVRIERDSRGLPDVLKKYHTMTDDELMEEVRNVFADSPVRMIDSEIEDVS